MLEKIDRYEIRKELGRGGMATVYSAYDPRFARDVAIKVLPPEFLYDSQFRARFEREARAIASLEHPAIVPVYDFGEHEGRLFLVMRLMSGGSLAEKIKSGPLPPAEVARILSRLAPALDAAHAQGLVHRDLKPGNILFDHWGEPYISDFGIVKQVDGSDTALTVAGGIVGTPAYMSPEQVTSDPNLDGRSDIYAIGCILFEMLTGQTPYKANTPIAVAFMHVTEPIPRLQALDKSLPPDCQIVLARAMAKERDERYPNTSSLSAAFQAAVNGETLATPGPVFPPTDLSDRTIIEPAPGTRKTSPARPKAQPPLIQPVQPAVTAEEPQQRSGLPRWALAGAAVLLLIVCIGGSAVVLSTLNNGRQGDDETQTPLAAVSETETITPTDLPAATPSATSAAIIVEDTATPTLAPTATPALPPAEAGLGDSWIRPLDGMTMLYVPPGSFTMGSDPNVDPAAGANEQPQHEVTLSGFWLDQTEVTNAMFAMFVADTGHVTTAEIEGDGIIHAQRQAETVPGTDWRHPSGPESNIVGLDSYPVVQVSWFDAEAYCTWAGGGLPSEAQWDYAARGPASNFYPWGNEFDGNLVNFCDVNCPFPYANGDYDDQSARLGPVGNLPGGASWMGAFDMVGNAWEWVADWYAADYYSNSPVENPTGPETGDAKALRGGSWYDDSPHVRAAQRGASNPATRHELFGFRCRLPAG